MHKMRLNELHLKGTLTPDGPVLVKSGGEIGADPTLPSMNFVRTLHPKSGEPTVYLPGSSLKGTFRSHVERIIRTVLGEDPSVCCDPLGRSSCGKRIEGMNRAGMNLNTAEEYKELCHACRIFGHTVHAGHFIASDAYPRIALNILPVRQGVAIDRFSGSSQTNALFDMEVAVEGQFELKIALVNFEIWQVGLLALTLRDLAEGRLLLGFGKSRGLGKVTLSLEQLTLAYPGRFDLPGTDKDLYGMAALSEALIGPYGLKDGKASKVAAPVAGSLSPDSEQWGRPTLSWDDEQAIWDVLKTSVSAWSVIGSK